ncbi:MAG: hypothetical protein FK734_20215 [Asgard group archaeon]|nr:hypothetical protein [Asgard group archaeon]
MIDDNIPSQNLLLSIKKYFYDDLDEDQYTKIINEIINLLNLVIENLSIADSEVLFYDEDFWLFVEKYMPLGIVFEFYDKCEYEGFEYSFVEIFVKRCNTIDELPILRELIVNMQYELVGLVSNKMVDISYENNLNPFLTFLDIANSLTNDKDIQKILGRLNELVPFSDNLSWEKLLEQKSGWSVEKVRHILNDFCLWFNDHVTNYPDISVIVNYDSPPEEISVSNLDEALKWFRRFIYNYHEVIRRIFIIELFEEFLKDHGISFYEHHITDLYFKVLVQICTINTDVFSFKKDLSPSLG